MKNRVCMVTGANSGIGKVTALELARLGATVVLVCRNQERGEAALAEIHEDTGNNSLRLLLADLSDLAQIESMVEQFTAEFSTLHVLVNNAGLLLGKHQQAATGVELTFATNHFGYFYTTMLLLDLIKASAPARIINVASDAHIGCKIDYDNLLNPQGYAGFRAYAQSKLANILFTKELARRLAGTQVTVNALHPGVVGTNFGQSGGALMRFAYNLGKPFMRSNESGAKTTVFLATDDMGGRAHGEYFANGKAKRPSRAARDPQAAAKLWEWTEAIIRQHTTMQEAVGA